MGLEQFNKALEGMGEASSMTWIAESAEIDGKVGLLR